MRRQIGHIVWVALVTLGGLGSVRAEAPPAPASTATVAGSKSSTAARSLSPEQALAGLQREIRELRSLTEGGMPDGVVAQNLFEVDLLDEAAIARRVEQLRAELAITSTQGATPVFAARLERDRLRLKLLSRSPEARSRLVAAEQQRRRLIDERQAAENALREAQAREVQAEAARLEALEAARQARTAAERALANERARLEASRSVLAAGEAALASRRQEANASLQKELERIGELEHEVHEPIMSPAKADQIYDRVVTQLEARRRELSAALDALNTPRFAQRFESKLDLGSAELDEFAEIRASLRQEIEEHRQATEKIAGNEREFLIGTANEIGTQVNRLNQLRLHLRPRLSEDKFSRLTSLTREGIAQLQRELSHLVLLSRWYFRARLARLLSFEALFSDIFAVGSASWSGLKALLVVLVAFYLRRRRKLWFRVLRRSIIARTKSRNVAFWADRWLSALEAVTPELILLATIYLVFRVFLERNSIPELDLLGDFLIAFAVFRVVLAMLHRSVTSAAEARSISVSPELSDRIYRSMRLISAYVFVVYVYLMLSEAILGRGNLHGIAASFAWLGVLPIGAILVARWRSSIVDSYLRTHPEGSLSNFVRKTKDQPLGFFAASLAFVFVAGRGLFYYVRETALGFDNTRRALAYVFRRRLEKQAEVSGRRSTKLELLPNALTGACSAEEDRPEAMIDFFPGLEGLLESARGWREGMPGRSVALVGEVGIGKTTWIQRFLGELGGEATHHVFDHRVLGEDRVISLLASVLGFEAIDDREALVSALRDAPPRLIVLDRCQDLFLRSIGGLAGYEALIEVASRTSDRHFWLLAHAERPWLFLAKVFRAPNRFDQTIELEQWGEEEIASLINKRMSLAGIRPVFDDLVIEKLDGTAFHREVIRSGERFQRLLWDYADGNPRIALHFWLRSLESDGQGRARVHLFDGPSADDLEHIQGPTRFVLAALVLHETLTPDEAATSLAFTSAQCDAALRYLKRAEVVDEVEGRYHVKTHWNRAVGRFLKRKGLIIA